MTFSELAAEAVPALAAAGIDDETARRDAVLLVRHLAGWDAARWLIEARSSTVPPELIDAFAPLLARRVKREPIAYIIGERDFYGRTFTVAPGVLIPRPETELVVDAVLDLARIHAAPRILDIGTGSGCLAITVALELPQAIVTATDLSERALNIARANARAFAVESRIDWRAGDLLAGTAGPFDIIMGNPPYVPDRDRASLEPEVVNYEPSFALFAGGDGLDVIQRLVPAAIGALTPRGSLVFEIGHGQVDAVEALIGSTPGLRLSRVLRDLRSIPRVVIVQRHPDGAAGL